jgi:hypothetical protein
MERVVEEWAGRLAGVSAARIAADRERLKAIGIDHLDNEFCLRADIDAMVGACMLTSSLDALIERGVPKTKLVAKLRGDPDVWPNLAEIVAGRLLLPLFGPGAEIEMDHGRRPDGPNADFRLTARGSGQSERVEFKALGLSAAENVLLRRRRRGAPPSGPELGGRHGRNG